MPLSDQPENRPLTPPELKTFGDPNNGTWMTLDEGEVDTTIRPTLLSPEVLRRLKEKYPEEGNQSLLAEENKQVPDAIIPSSSSRGARIQRQTGETKIDLNLALDGQGQGQITTGIGFFDHMLTLLAKHSLFDLTVQAQGDLQVDPHHTVEDVGICLGKALGEALGTKAGIRRYGSCTLPMDETLVTVAVDLSGRAFCVWNVSLPPEILGTFNAPLAEEFWRAVATSGACNLHVLCHYGRNTHHIIEGVFKAAARALRQAVELDPRMSGVPSTKGVL